MALAVIGDDKDDSCGLAWEIEQQDSCEKKPKQNEDRYCA
jgi:hypothetical protein